MLPESSDVYLAAMYTVYAESFMGNTIAAPVWAAIVLSGRLLKRDGLPTRLGLTDPLSLAERLSLEQHSPLSYR